MLNAAELANSGHGLQKDVLSAQNPSLVAYGVNNLGSLFWFLPY
jgi:hypothetical protein